MPVSHDQLGFQPPRRRRSMSALELADVREAAYRLFSQALLYPTADRCAALCEAARELSTYDAALVQFAFYADWRRVLSTVQAAAIGPHGSIQEQHVALFGASKAGTRCPPYESAFVSPGGQPDGLQLARIEAAYSEIGLAPSRELGELPDHVAIELEFMAMLCGREADAWEGEDAASAAKSMGRAKRFLDGHLSVWLPAFARHVAAHDAGGFYRTVSQGAATFALYDRDWLAAFLEGVANLDAPVTNGSQGAP